MAGKVSANLTISFSAITGDDEGTTLTMEVNAEDNNGKTSFAFTDTAYYRVYKGPRLTSVNYYCSKSGVDSQHLATKSGDIKNEVITFVNTNTANTAYPIYSNFSATLMAGNSLGTLGWTSGSSNLEGTAAKEGDPPIIAIYLVNYTTQFEVRKISGVSAPSAWPVDEDYPILIVAVGTYT